MRMKNLWILSMCTAVCALLSIAFFGNREPVAEVKKVGFGYDSSKCEFVDYRIEGENVIFRYKFHLTNTSTDPAYDIDMPIELDARFRARDLRGWVEYQNYFSAEFSEDEPDRLSDRAIIMRGQTERDVIVSFTGKYLGGEVNTSLSAPTIMLDSMWPEYYPNYDEILGSKN